MDLYKISKPDLSKIDYKGLFEKYSKNKKAVKAYVQSITYPKYLPWGKARFKNPVPGFTKEESWILGHDLRTITAKKTPIRTPGGESFSWTRLEYTDNYLNKFDMFMGGHFMATLPRLTHSENQKFLSRGLIEEAIASSQLEGATVTRQRARDMIAENQTPRDKSEWMIHNNYQMMLKLTGTYRYVPMSRELLLEMHQLLTTNTMPEDEIGRFRDDDDGITVGSTTITTHVPPPEAFLDKALDDLISYANDNSEENFIHPVIKAIFLHFWIGYLHPFTDGNGRVARALFYWLLLKNNYWLATYIPISTVIKRSAIQYSDAYIYSEQDDFDLTYFYDYHMKKIKRALDDFLSYIEEQRAENEAIDRLLGTRARLNDRQKQVMHYLLSNQHNNVTITSHATLNNISLNTSRKDIEELASLQLVFALRSGKFVRYYARPIS